MTEVLAGVAIAILELIGVGLTLLFGLTMAVAVF
jgi:hypothetical protein